MSLQAIFFDLDGTLRHNDPPAIPFFHSLAAELGVETDSQTRLHAERWTHTYWAESDDLRADLEAYGPWENNGAFWANHARRHLQALNASEDVAAALAPVITKKMLDIYEPVDSVPDDVIPTLEQLRNDGYKLAIISNRNKPFTELLVKHGLQDAVDFSLASGEVGHWKPNPKVFLHAASMAGVAPDQVAYVGDNYFADAHGARGAGMLPVLLDPNDLFPDADCLRIKAIGDLPGVLMRVDRA
jgi:HAD superfamily hydrolase (TIGR01549 family)